MRNYLLTKATFKKACSVYTGWIFIASFDSLIVNGAVFPRTVFNKLKLWIFFSTPYVAMLRVYNNRYHMHDTSIQITSINFLDRWNVIQWHQYSDGLLWKVMVLTTSCRTCLYKKIFCCMMVVAAAAATCHCNCDRV